MVKPSKYSHSCVSLHVFPFSPQQTEDKGVKMPLNDRNASYELMFPCDVDGMVSE